MEKVKTNSIFDSKKFGMQLRKKSKAFTLLESIFAIILVGIAICALMVAFQSSTDANSVSMKISSANNLINNFYELSLSLDKTDPQSGKQKFGPEENSLLEYDDLDDFTGLEFCPPIDSSRQSLDEYKNFTQKISIINVQPGDLQTQTSAHSSGIVKVEVGIFYNGEEIARESWLRSE